MYVYAYLLAPWWVAKQATEDECNPLVMNHGKVEAAAGSFGERAGDVSH